MSADEPHRGRILRAIAEHRKTQPRFAAVPEPISADEDETPPPIDTTAFMAEMWAQRHNAARLDSLERDVAGTDKVVDELLRTSVLLEELMPMWRATARHVDILAEARTKELTRTDNFHNVEFPRLLKLTEKLEGRFDALDKRLTVHDAVQAELGRNDSDHRRALAELEPLKLEVANLNRDKAIAEALRAEREKADARRLVVYGLAITLFAAVLAVVLTHFIH